MSDVREMWDRVINGDSLEVLKSLPDNCIDALVTDPPAGINFMNKEFDHNRGGRQQWIAWLTAIMQEVYRVMKPGAHGLVWALPRTSHWTTTALEDANFEIRDKIYHLFGSGMPKSFNLGEGRGTGLKPSVEEWILIRKPISEDSVTTNVQKWGTGGLNIDICRVPASVTTSGRWPAQLVLSHTLFCTDVECAEGCPITELDKQSGITSSHGGGHVTRIHFNSPAKYHPPIPKGDTGGASRFFINFYYASKASKRERNAGCESLPVQKTFDKNTSKQIAHINHKTGNVTYNEYTPSANQNDHPTTKSLSLMRYICRLVTPPDGIVLDCFAGSGSTLVACIQEGFRFIGIEQDEHYCQIARARIAATSQPPG